MKTITWKTEGYYIYKLATIKDPQTMRIILSVSIISILLVIYGCQSSKEHNIDPSTYQFEELFNELLVEIDSTRQNSIITHLKDSLDNYHYPGFNSRVVIDSSNAKIDLHFEFFNTWYDFKLNYRNIFEFFLTRDNEVHCDPRRLKGCDSLQENLEEFIFNPSNDWHLPEKKICIDAYGDTIWTTNQFVFINCALIPDSLGCASSWLDLRNLILSTIDYYRTIQDDYASRMWAKGIDELDINQLDHVWKVIPIRINVFLNREHNKRVPKPIITNDEINAILENDSIEFENSLL